LYLNTQPKEKAVPPSQSFLLLTLTVSLLATSACSARAARVRGIAAPTQTDNSYFDLAPGWRLRIVVPLLKPGAEQAVQLAGQAEGNTIVLSAPNLEGYQVSYYSVERSGDGRVRLKFAAAETNRDGKTIPEPSAPVLPFPLPAKAGHIRLIYLIRESKSDHNMAIAISKRLNALNSFTERFQRNQGVCGENGEVSCVWVPTQIAVRPENVSAPSR
jgi:hypothetical protein